MASFRERVEILFDTVADLGGAKRMRAEMAKLQAQAKRLDNSVFGGDFQTVFQKGQFPSGSSKGGQFLPQPDGRLETFKTRFNALANSGRRTSRIIGRIGLASAIGAQGLGRVKKAAGEAANMISNASFSARSLQMRLLGLQFTALTTAFIFGGLASSALSAVGVFKTLGNSLKFLFLPSALGALDQVLKLQNAILGLDEETRKMIGDLVLGAATVSLLVTVFAALGKAVVALKGVFSVISPIVKGLVMIFNFFGAQISTVAGMITPLIGFIAGLAAGFLVVTKTAKEFGKKVAAVVGVVLVAIGGLIAIIAGAPVIIAAAIGLIIGALIGLAVTFKDTLINAVKDFVTGTIDFLKGLVSAFMDFINFIVNFVVGGFVDIYRKVVGGSIIPKMINEIIGWFFKLPKKMLEFGSKIVRNIAKGIKNVGTAIWDALKKVLPQFMVDALEAGGQAIKGIVKKGGNIIGKGGKVIGDAVSGITSTVSGIDVPGIGGNQNTKPGGGGGPRVQRNNININKVEANQNETPIETGDRLGQGISQGMNNQTAHFAGGT